MMEPEVERGTDNITKIEEAIYKFPHLLKGIRNTRIADAIDILLPYSCGVEFECFKKDNYNKKYFTDIHNILDVEVDPNEQRYRIPNGLNGLICLYDICEGMRKFSKVDLASSNHYHIDMTDVRESTHGHKKFQDDNNGWIIEELKKWGTAMNYNEVRGWYKYNFLGTLEIRIGEPTFEYSMIARRLIQSCDMVRRLKYKVDPTEHKLHSLYSQLELLKEKNEEKEPSEEEMNRIITKRIIKT